MKKSFLRTLTVILFSCLFLCLFAVVFASAAEAKTVSDSDFSSIIMNVGADETQRNLTFYSTVKAEGEIRYGKSENGALPATYSVAKTIRSKTSKPGFYSYKATLTGLEENTTYVYAIVVGDKMSSPRTFRVNEMGDSFTFAFIADAQVGSSGESALWQDTLQKLNASFPQTSFIVSAGDQTSDASLESNFDYFTVPELATLPVSTTVGPPHDNSMRYAEHYNLPNLSSNYGVSNTSSDYYFTYNNLLVMHLNVENTSYDSHKTFLENTIANNPDCLWRVVVLHYSFFTGGDHSLDSAVQNFRNNLAGTFTDLGIDVVLSGHDHMYSRSNMMSGSTTLSGDTVTNNSVTDPNGTLYLCNTRPSGGSGYTVIQHDDDAYIAYRTEVDRKAVTIFEVSEGSLVLKSYFMDKDTPELFDTFTINKTAPTVRVNNDNNKLELLDGESRVSLVDAYAYTKAIVKVVNGNWALSTNGGTSYESLGIPSSSTSTVLRINATSGMWELSTNDGTSYTSLNIQSKSYTIKFVTDINATVGDATDLSIYTAMRFTQSTPDALFPSFPRGSLDEGIYNEWSWEYYTTSGTKVTSFSYGNEYLAYPVAAVSYVANQLYLASSSIPEQYTYAWSDAWDIMRRFAGESFTLTLKENVSLPSSSKITVTSPIDVTLDLNGYTLSSTNVSQLFSFYVGSSTSVFKVVTTKESGTLKAGKEFIQVASNTGSVVSVQFGSEESYPLTVNGALLVDGSSNFKHQSTLNLAVYNGTYNLSDSLFFVTNIKADSSKNVYNVTLKDATFNFTTGASALITGTGADYEARDTSYLNATNCTFANTDTSGASVRTITAFDNWRGSMSFTSCTFKGMSLGHGADGRALTKCSSVSVSSDCIFYNSDNTFLNTFPLTFACSKISIPSGYVMARVDENGGLSMVPETDTVKITWNNPVGFTDYWKKNTKVSYPGPSSFILGAMTYTLVPTETPAVATADRTYNFKDAEGKLYRYDEARHIWQIQKDGDSYKDVTAEGFGIKVIVDGEATTYPVTQDFYALISSFNSSSYSNKEIIIILGEDFVMAKIVKFTKAPGAKLIIDLAGNKLTLAGAGKVQFSSIDTLHIYSSAPGGHLYFNSGDDCIQFDTGAKLIFGSEEYKNYLTVSATKYLINFGNLTNGMVFEANYLYTTFNCGTYGILRLCVLGSDAATLKVTVKGCTVNGSDTPVCYNASSNLSATSGGGVFTVDSYMNFEDCTFKCTATSEKNFFGHKNFTNRYYGKVSFVNCSFSGFELNGSLIRSAADSSYNTYYSSLTGYNPDDCITVGRGCTFTNYASTFNSSVTDFKASNVSLAENCTISKSGSTVTIKQSTPAFVSTYLNLTNELNLVFRVYLPTGMTATVTFTIGDEVMTVEHFSVDENGLYLFKLPSINPAEMGKTVTATLNPSSGSTISAEISIKQYLDKLRAANETNKDLIALIDALLVYGAAAQGYIGDTSTPVATVDSLSAIPEAAITKSGNGFVKFGMTLEGAFTLRVGIAEDVARGATLAVTYNGNTTTYALDGYTAKGGVVTFILENVTATDLGKDITFTLKSGTATIGTLTMSANAYLYRIQQANTSTKLTTLARAIYAYGKAAESYTK